MKSHIFFVFFIDLGNKMLNLSANSKEKHDEKSTFVRIDPPAGG
jgi:hypothetical protein